jgi:hypothetical protein
MGNPEINPKVTSTLSRIINAYPHNQPQIAYGSTQVHNPKARPVLGLKSMPNDGTIGALSLK